MILDPSRRERLACIGREEVRQQYGVDPKEAPGLHALRGDLQTNCWRGVAPKRAAQWRKRTVRLTPRSALSRGRGRRLSRARSPSRAREKGSNVVWLCVRNWQIRAVGDAVALG